MQQDSLLNDLYIKLRSYEWIYPRLLEQAEEERYDPDAGELKLKFFGVKEQFLDDLDSDTLLNDIKALGEFRERFGQDESSGVENLLDNSLCSGADELAIAEKLRECCDVFGKENHHKLKYTAGYLLELGKLYLSYAATGTDIEQKMNFIRSATLIVAAAVRYEKLMMEEKHENALEQLRNLNEEITKAADAKGMPLDITGFSKDIKHRLRTYRDKITTELNMVVRIDSGDSDDSSMSKMKKKIAQMQKISEQSTEYYIDILQSIANTCERILGDSPCEFAVVGLGSLARREVTLYSDFEHVIVLENGVDDDSPAKEYFRWFTTIFHIIIIGLGETIVPSVDVRSLCDLYSNDKSRKWFSDEYTPCGISFDGMMPHACKIPLGRSKPTQSRKHIIELIQPASNMAQYVNQEEEIKNGYFLSDVLSTTCFVYGNRSVYDAFSDESQRIINQKTRKEIINEQLRNILSNPNEEIRNVNYYSSFQNKNIKRSIYRPITVLLSCIASLHEVSGESRSSFELVDALKDIGVIDEERHCRLMYVVAATMEVRLKTYSVTGHQRRSLTHAEVASIIGEEAVVDCYITLMMLKKAANSTVWEFCKQENPQRELILPPKSSSFWETEKVLVLLASGNFRKAMKLALEIACSTLNQFANAKLKAVEAKYSLQMVFFSLVQCLSQVYYTQAMKTLEGWYGDSRDFSFPATFDLKKWEWCCRILRQLTEDKQRSMLQMYHQSMCLIYFFQRHYKQAWLEWSEFQINWSWGIGKNTHSEQLLMLWMFEIFLMSYALGGNEILELIKTQLFIEKNYQRQAILNVGMCQAWLKLGLKKKAKKALSSVVMDAKKNCRRLGKTGYKVVLQMVQEIQIENLFLLDTQVTTHFLSEITADDFVEEINFQSPVLRMAQRDFEKMLSHSKNLHALQEYVEKSGNPRLDKAKELMMLGNIGLQKIYCAFSYREMIANIRAMLTGHKGTDTSSRALKVAARKTLFACYVGCWMALLENVRYREKSFLLEEFLTAPGRLKTLRVLQPFVYGCFTDFISMDPIFSDDCKETNGLLSKVMFAQHTIFKALFGYSGNNVYHYALLLFINLRFQPCAKLLWKLLHWNRGGDLMRVKSAELFLTTLLTVLVLQKRHKPSKYFVKTREISLVQTQHFIMSVTGNMNVYSLKALVLCQMYRYSADPVTPIYNLAVEYFQLDIKSSANLLWKILQKPHLSRVIKHASLFFFYFALNTHVLMNLNPLEFQQKGLAGIDRMQNYGLRNVMAALKSCF